MVLTLHGWSDLNQFVPAPKGYRSYHGADDVHQAIGMLDYLSGDNEILTAYAKLMNLRARAFVASTVNWRTVEHLAAVLLDRRTMTGAEVRAAIREGVQRQFPKPLSPSRTNSPVAR